MGVIAATWTESHAPTSKPEAAIVVRSPSMAFVAGYSALFCGRMELRVAPSNGVMCINATGGTGGG